MSEGKTADPHAEDVDDETTEEAKPTGHNATAGMDKMTDHGDEAEATTSTSSSAVLQAVRAGERSSVAPTTAYLPALG